MNIFVAFTLVDTMAGDPAEAAKEPLYVKLCAPVDEIADVDDPAIIEPVMLMFAADEIDNPLAPAPPITEPEI